MANRKNTTDASTSELKLDLGCWKTPQDGFLGVDIVSAPGIKRCDLTQRWPWKDGSVDEVYTRDLIPYFTPGQRIHFANELCRVLKRGAKAQLIVTHWCSTWAYADLGRVYPPVSEGWLYYLNREWRENNAPWSTCYTCDFDFTCGYAMHAHLVTRNHEYQTHALQFWKEAAQHIIATLIKR